jgi:asparagine synthase (glutamine-hydrolysing)
MLAQPVSVRTQLGRPGDPHYGHLLWSRQTIELSAATPTYVLTNGGRTRAVARAAFRQDVPETLIARRSKGNPGSFVANLMAANRNYVREKLLDGELVKQGVLDRGRLEQALSGNPTDVSSSELLLHLCTENWLSLQQESHARAKAA